MVSPDPAAPSLIDAAHALATGELGSAELVEACLRRARDAANLGAWVLLDEQRARREAGAAEPGTSPLAGVPVAIKDNVDVAGWATRCGTEASDPTPAASDAEIVRLLRRAGAVILGKVATHEITYGVTTRAVRNPVDVTRLAGGSSGGSAVAVATGACLLAVGSDTAGSVRIPAALCGVAGVMGPGLPTGGVRPLAPSLDRVGLLARTAHDLTLAWRALTGESTAAPPKRIGVVDARALGRVDDDVVDAVDVAVRALEAEGAELVSVTVPPFSDFARARAIVIAAEALTVQRHGGAWPARAAAFGAAVRGQLELAEDITAEAVEAARAEQRQLAADLRDVLGSVDVLALPSTPCVAPPADDGDPPERADRRLAGILTRLCGPINAASLAAVSVPCGSGADGLPVGLQLVAHDEAHALAAAVAYEAAARPQSAATSRASGVQL